MVAGRRVVIVVVIVAVVFAVSIITATRGVMMTVSWAVITRPAAVAIVAHSQFTWVVGGGGGGGRVEVERFCA